MHKIDTMIRIGSRCEYRPPPDRRRVTGTNLILSHGLPYCLGSPSRINDPPWPERLPLARLLHCQRSCQDPADKFRAIFDREVGILLYWHGSCFAYMYVFAYLAYLCAHVPPAPTCVCVYAHMRTPPTCRMIGAPTCRQERKRFSQKKKSNKIFSKKSRFF